MVFALAGANQELRALYPAASIAGSAPGLGVNALPRSRCMASVSRRMYAAALVLRSFLLVAYSENAPADYFHSRDKLDSGNLALVSHVLHRHASRALIRSLLLFADACGCALATVARYAARHSSTI